MSIRKVQHDGKSTQPIVTKGKPLSTAMCPACGGDAVPTIHQNKPAHQCTRCGQLVVAKKF